MPFGVQPSQRAPVPPPPPKQHELTPSSVEIPIIVSGDTPLSGENMPVEATEMESRRPASSSRNDLVRGSSDASEFEEYPTQVQASPFDEPRPEDQHTTQRRGSVLGHQLAARPARAETTRRSVKDTDTNVRPPAIRDTDATGRPAMLRDRRSTPDIRDARDDREDRDDQETIIRSNAPFPLQKRRPRKPSSPDDTIKLESEPNSMEGDPTQLMTPRAPKAPRR